MSNEITVNATVDNLTQVIDFIDAQLESAGCSMKPQMQVDIAVEELFVNVASYAYDGMEGEITIRFDVDRKNNTAVITLIDRGVPYDPLKKEDPDVSLSAEQRQIGGLGIFMVKKSMDSMEYRYENKCNIVTLRKKMG